MSILETVVDLDIRAYSREQGGIEGFEEEFSIGEKGKELGGISPLVSNDDGIVGWIVANIELRHSITVSTCEGDLKVGESGTSGSALPSRKTGTIGGPGKLGVRLEASDGRSGYWCDTRACFETWSRYSRNKRDSSSE
jgi:hypothetical protein